jgi:dihydrodipicolinate synthase/N-acetylneuraminate lyase
VDFDALKSLVEWQIAEGSHGLVPVGTTGESPTLTHDEHEKVIEAVVEAAAGRVPVIAGAGSNNTVEACASSNMQRPWAPMPRWSSRPITTSRRRRV